MNTALEAIRKSYRDYQSKGRRQMTIELQKDYPFNDPNTALEAVRKAYRDYREGRITQSDYTSVVDATAHFVSLTR